MANYVNVSSETHYIIDKYGRQIFIAPGEVVDLTAGIASRGVPWLRLQSAVDSESFVARSRDIGFTPDGDLAATVLRDAILELRDDTDAKVAAEVVARNNAIAAAIGNPLLDTELAIDLKTVAPVDLYTVLASTRAQITDVILEVTASDTVTVAPTVRLLGEAVELVAATALTGLDAVGETWLFRFTGLNKWIPATEDLKLDVTIGATATTLTAKAYVFGLEEAV